MIHDHMDLENRLRIMPRDAAPQAWRDGVLRIGRDKRPHMYVFGHEPDELCMDLDSVLDMVAGAALEWLAENIKPSDCLSIEYNGDDFTVRIEDQSWDGETLAEAAIYATYAMDPRDENARKVDAAYEKWGRP